MSDPVYIETPPAWWNIIPDANPEPALLVINYTGDVVVLGEQFTREEFIDALSCLKEFMLSRRDREHIFECDCPRCHVPGPRGD